MKKDYSVGVIFREGQKEFRSDKISFFEAEQMVRTAASDNYHRIRIYVNVGSKRAAIDYADLPGPDGGPWSDAMLKSMASEKLRSGRKKIQM